MRKHVDHSKARLILTDFAAAMCAQLHEIPGASVKQCDAANLPFADKSFNWVIANYMLYHLDDPDRALKEFTRVLRPDGHLIVALNGRDHLAELLEIGLTIGRTSTILNGTRITAETAPEYLERHFADITFEASPGDFIVPEPEPILDYLDSWDDEPLTAEQEYSARKLIESIIATQGSFRVRKRMVLFTAHHPYHGKLLNSLSKEQEGWPASVLMC